MSLGARSRLTLLLGAGVIASCTLYLDEGLSGGDAPDAGAEAGDGSSPPLDEIRNGTGRNGPLTVSGEIVLNTYALLEADANRGAVTLTTAADAGWTAGDLVLVWQTTGSPASPSSSSTTPLDLAASPVGLWELVRLRATAAKTLTLEKPISGPYRGGVTQIVRVPEHTDVTIAPSGIVRALPWDGAKGGIVVFLATGKIQVDGAIKVDEQGFRGGQFFRNASFENCTQLDGLPKNGYAAKGEGIAPAAFAFAGAEAPGGRGVVANGGGGGNCHNAGGGGGGNGGAGGKGGRTFKSSNRSDLGGFGGRPLIAAEDTRVILGGGGGAGESEDTPNERSVSGARGGGVVVLRAALLHVAGSISARGGAGAKGDYNGGGGGGAGGTIKLRATERITCAGNGIVASGGNGTTNEDGSVGPGGGGGGGQVVLRAPVIDCAPNVSAGSAGTAEPEDSGLGANYGALPGSTGAVVTGP